MARKLEVIITGDTASLEKAFGRAGKQASSFEKGIGKASKVATVGLAAMAAGGYKLAQSSAAQAEAQNKTNEVFGKSAGAMDKWSSTTANAMGISKTASLQASAGFGALFTNIGEGEAKAATFSQKMVVAAGDLASFHDALPTEALEAMTSALAGEFEPLRKFQIFLSAAKIEAEAMRLGLIKQGEAMDDNAKVIATRSLVLGNLGKAEGDMARTMDSASNSAKRATAVSQDLAATQGKALLPAYTLVTGALRTLSGVMASHTGVTQVAVGVIGGLAVAVLAVSAAMKVATASAWLFSASTTAAGTSSRAYMVVAGLARAATLAWAGAQAVLNAVLTANPIGLVIVALVALGVALVVAYQKSETFRTIVNAAFNSVKAVVGGVIDFIGDHWQAMLSLLAGPAVLAIGQISKAWQGLQTVVATVISAILGAIDKFLGGLSAIARAASHLPFVGDKFKGVANAIDNTRESVRRLQAEIDGMRGKTIEIRVNTVHHELSVDDREGGRGGRAAGGPVTAGGRYLVGEKGPELFVPNRSGTIIPNGGVPRAAMAGAGGGNTYNIYASTTYGDDQSVQRLVGKIRQEIRRGTARNG